jgi:hypothetical protein
MNGTTLYTTDVNDPTGFRAATLDEIMAGTRHALSIRIRKGTVLNSPKATADFLIARLAQREHEVFTLIYLDLSGALVYVRKRVLMPVIWTLCICALHISDTAPIGLIRLRKRN